MEKRSLSSEDKRPEPVLDFSLGGGFMAFVTFRWASTLLQEAGQKPSEHILTLLAIAAGFVVVLLLIEYLLWRLRFRRAVRSAIWASAAFGPYAALFAWSELGHPVWSQVIGMGSTILIFMAFYALDLRLPGNTFQTREPGKTPT